MSAERRLGAKGRAWFGARLEAVLCGDQARTPEELALIPHVVAFYVERWREVVRWVPYETYAGPGFAAGAWRIDLNAVYELARWREAWAEARRAARVAADADARTADARRYRTLDDWLEADRRGQLGYRGAVEPEAYALLPQERAWTIVATAVARRARWPRPCRTCGEEFRPAVRGRVRCQTCLASRSGAADSCGATTGERARGRRSSHSA